MGTDYHNGECVVERRCSSRGDQERGEMEGGCRSRLGPKILLLGHTLDDPIYFQLSFTLKIFYQHTVVAQAWGITW